MLFTSSWLRVLTAIGLCSGLLGPDAWAASCVKSLRWVETPPYAFKDAQGDIRGLHVDLATAALQRLGCEVRLVEMPWARAIVELQLGRLDLLAGAANIPERASFALFSRPTNSARNVLFIQAQAEPRYTLNTLADLIGTDFRLAVQRGSSYSPAYDALLKNPEFVERLTYVYAQESALRMMIAGRVEGQLGDELWGLDAIRRLGLESTVKRSKLVLSEEADHIAFSKATNSAAFVKRFDNALGDMLADGSYERILRRYLNCPVRMERLGCQ